MFEQRHPAGLVLLGLIAGIVAFVGCFVPFFVGGVAGNILDAGSFWFDFVPVLLGLATLALLVPRATVAAILPLGAVGLAIAAKATIDGIDFAGLIRQVNHITGASGGSIPLSLIGRALHSGFGPGPGFFMIVIAGTVLALVWARIVHDMVVARFGSITEIIAVRGATPASPGADSGSTTPASPGADSGVPSSSAAPTATPDMTAAPAPDPAPPSSS